jgi:hypothetical protein
VIYSKHYTRRNILYALLLLTNWSWREAGKMAQDALYILIVAGIVLSDIVIWLRIARLSPGKRRRDQIFSGVAFALAAIVILGVWLLMRR